MRQKSAPAERAGVAHGEAVRDPVSDEANSPRRDTESTGSGLPETLLGAALTRENLRQAWKRVKANKGAAGVDGLDIEQTARHLVKAWPTIREHLLRGTYRPGPVRRVTIPKPDGGERELGIPTVTDRLIQQALLQVLQPLLDPTFSEHSHGFRPGRRAHDAVLAAHSYVQSGRRIVVDVDLEKFFDRVSHDILIDRLRKRIEDAGIIRLIRAYLNSGIMRNGVVLERYQGTPQGGPLSPLLANVMPDEVDKVLEKHGHCFARYADDCNVYVRSRRAGERVMALLRRCYAKLQLKVNEAKSAVASVTGEEIPGLRLLVCQRWGETPGGGQADGGVQATGEATHPALGRTQHGGGHRATEALPAGMESLLWAGANAGRLAHAGRMAAAPAQGVQLKHWKRGSTIYRELTNLGAAEHVAKRVAGNARCWLRNSAGELNRVLTIAYFDKLGAPRLS